MNANVDHEEVEKFAVLAARWWDKNSEFKPLHDINPLRLNYIKEQCGGSLEGKRILDVGCGGGISCSWCVEKDCSMQLSSMILLTVIRLGTFV